MKESKFKKAFPAAFPRTLPVMAGYLVLGFGFGLLLQSKGYSFWWAILMSVTVYGGSMQYAAVDMLASGVSLITCAIMSLLIQARHLFYGISMLIRYRDVGRVKPYLIFAMTDETYSLVCTGDVPEGLDKGAYYFWICVLDHSYWIVGCTLGAVFGQLVPINTAGVDFAMTALFLVIMMDNLLQKDRRIPALIGAAISFICLMIFGADNFLIPAMIGIALALILLRPVFDKKEAAQ